MLYAKETVNTNVLSYLKESQLQQVRGRIINVTSDREAGLNAYKSLKRI